MLLNEIPRRFTGKKDFPKCDFQPLFIESFVIGIGCSILTLIKTPLFHSFIHSRCKTLQIGNSSSNRTLLSVILFASSKDVILAQKTLHQPSEDSFVTSPFRRVFNRDPS